MSNLTASVYMDWGQPLRIFTGAVEQEKESLEVPFFVSVRDFAANVGSSTIRKWGSPALPCPGSIQISNSVLTNKQEPHYRCTAVPFTEIRKLTNNTDMHPRNKDRANAIIKWLEPIYREYAATIVKPIATGIKALTPKFSEITANDTEQEQKAKEKLEYRKLRESGMTASEALTAVLGEPEKRPRVACESTVPIAFTVDDVAKRLYELKQENESLKSEVEKLKKELDDYQTIRDMFLSIGGD